MGCTFTREFLRLYILTDTDAIGDRDLCTAVGDAIDGGATLVQYRDKHADRKTMYANALQLRALTRERGIPFVINDYVDLALAVEADGVHVGQDDLPAAVVRRIAQDRLWVGVSTHSIEEAGAALADEPAYLAVGPVFPTRTKANPDPVIGVEGVRAVRTLVGPDVPLVAIGGIDLSTAAAVRKAGADGIAVVSAIWSSDIVGACRALATS